MIRREQLDERGQVAAWLLVSQIEHARLAGELATAWRDESLAAIEPRDEFLAAVFRHDDGWIPWELRPGVCEGRPRDFMEMPLDESAAIWRRSIAVARAIGPLAAYAVSAHFAFLCRMSRDKEPRSEEWLHLADDFLAEQVELQNDWTAELEVRGAIDAIGVGNRACHWLQFFDRVSLWLCCAERRETAEIDVPEIASFTFRPVSPAQIVVEPWPLTGDTLEVAVRARRVPAIDYPTPDALSSAPGEASTLRWRFSAA